VDVDGGRRAGESGEPRETELSSSSSCSLALGVWRAKVQEEEEERARHWVIPPPKYTYSLGSVQY